MDKKHCGICGREFISKGGRKYCEECRQRIIAEYAFRVEHEEQAAPRKTCIVCGKAIDHVVYDSETVCSVKCAHTLYAITDKWRAKRRRGQAKRTYHRSYELEPPKKRKPLKIESHLGQDIQEARKRGLEYGAYMAMKKWGGALRW